MIICLFLFKLVEICYIKYFLLLMIYITGRYIFILSPNSFPLKILYVKSASRENDKRIATFSQDLHTSLLQKGGLVLYRKLLFFSIEFIFTLKNIFYHFYTFEIPL